MLYFENGKIRQNGISFALPNAFYFDPCDDEAMFESGLRVWSKTRDYYLQFVISEDCESTDTELERLLHADGSTVISGMEEIVCGGLHGHQAFYTYGRDEERYFELRLALPDDLQFSLLIATTGDIQALVQSEEIRNILGAIHAE